MGNTVDSTREPASTSASEVPSPSSRLQYPPADRRPESVTFGSVSYDDPYRWLEEDSEESLSWQTAQDKLSAAYLSALPTYAGFLDRLATLGTTNVLSVPRFSGGRWFRRRLPEGEDLEVLEVADSPTGPGRRIVDLNAMYVDEPLQLDMFTPSPDGRKIAIAWGGGGREMENFQILDVDSGEVLLDGIPQKRAFFVAWTPDGSAIYYHGYDPEISMEDGFVFKHVLGEAPPARHEPLELSHPVIMPRTSVDGRHILLYASHLDPRPDYILDTAGDDGWQPFLKDVPARFRGDIIGDRFIAITDEGAPRGRLVSIPLATPTQRETWQELVPLSDAVLASVAVVGERIVLLDLVDTYSRVRVFAADGTAQGEIALPSRGVVNAFGGTFAVFNIVDCLNPGDRDEVIFIFNTPSQAPALYSANVADLTVSQLTEPPAELDAKVVDRNRDQRRRRAGALSCRRAVRRRSVEAPSGGHLWIWRFQRRFRPGLGRHDVGCLDPGRRGAGTIAPARRRRARAGPVAQRPARA